MPVRRFAPRPADGAMVLVEGAQVDLSTRTASRIVVAASDATSPIGDFLCDGVNDEVQLNAAVAVLPTRGGTIELSDGRFNLGASWVVDANKRIRIEADGALLVPAAGVTALLINQGNVTARGVRVDGLRIDGLSAATTTGVELRDTNNAELAGVSIENCTTGILFNSFAASGFVEGSLLDNLILRGNTIGVDFAIASGTGSFAQTIIRGLKCVVGGVGTGLRLANPGILQRSYIQGTFWVDTNQTGVSLDGNIEDVTFNLAVEGAAASSGNTGLTLGTNLTNSDQAFITLLFTGTLATQVSNAFTKNYHFWTGGSQIVQSAGTVVLGYRRHGDTANRLQFEGLTAGGKIQFGTGGIAVDTEIHRSAADVLSSADKFDPASFNNQTKAGTPVDGDIVGGAADGDMVVDTTANKIWVRIGGTWKGVVVA